MTERPIVFGSGCSLVGVVTEPRKGVRAADRPACLFLNAGVIHHVGPNRLHVHLARHLAELGFLSFRFDFSSRGDSDARSDGLAFAEATVIESREAMDMLQKNHGCERFVLMGICSGAVASFQAALADPRVVGAVLIDIAAYPTTGYYLRRYLRRARSLESWKNFLRRNLPGRLLRAPRAPEEAAAPGEIETLFGTFVLPPRSEAERAIAGLLDRGVRLLLIYSGSWTAYNYRDQFKDAFPGLMKRGAIQVEYYPDADHTFTRLASQRRLARTVTDWLVRKLPEAGTQNAA